MAALPYDIALIIDNQEKIVTESAHPSPERILQMITGFQMSAAMKAAIDIGLFTKIAEGNTTADALAIACDVAERGVRILCDTLSVLGFLNKANGEYSLAEDAAFFLDQNSPAYMGAMTDFILSTQQKAGFKILQPRSRMAGRCRKRTLRSTPRVRCGRYSHAAWPE